jgi:hypothetical protein
VHIFLIMSREQNSKKFVVTGTPVEVPPFNPTPPVGREFLRLPPAGHRCVETGLSRSALNFLILPSAANNHCPPVHSYSLRRDGNRFGSRLIDYQSLRAYVHAHAEPTSGPTAEKKDAA